MRHQWRAVAVALAGIAVSRPAFAQDISLATNAAGITVGGTKPSYTTGFGLINGLGLGTPGANQTILTPSGGGGVVYTSPYDVVVSGASNPNRVSVRAYVSTNFVHSSILKVYSCVSSCTSGANFTAMSTNSGSQTDVIASPGVASSQTVTRYLAVFAGNQNGASAFTGTDSATITLNVYRDNNGSLLHTYTLALNTPNENMQTALRLTLATAVGGAPISPASDYSLAFGNVNGLGINPGSGLTAASASGGKIYSTPYLLQPSFSSFSSTTATLKTYVSTDFVHPSQLELRDSTSGSTFSAISKASGSQTTLTSSASSGTAVTRYLGLFVANTNSAGIYTGSDNATVTFTLVVP
jgi:hypothetical protein